jgi:hypothetical protein
MTHGRALLSERFNKTLEELIRKNIKESNRWDEVVDAALFAYIEA